ncbi:Serine/threonine-protein kinase F [Planktothrix agardhii]|uniref:non-specific serine/threonine protein kinase n=1 Tax=Planktothrix agardhii TaxID=1160 RepID=A0A1J1JDS2_PLAAG|nr:serine/threonine-protein kinase [Planktothrix agardhii]CAD5954642.1 Serine/threonine-protein kinase F [Planktothrix agardhii]CUM59539.1 Serine/threonine kinase [Planktothrix agardhii]
MTSPTIHCINPQCSHPSNQPWGNKFCQSCGAPLQLNQRYIPLHNLGTGGFSRLYTVWDLKTQTEKVLKVLLEPSPKALELFEQEAEVLAQLRHPGVPRVEADGYFYLKKRNVSEGHLPCLVMEKIHGHTLQEILEQYPQGCPEDWVISWLSQALDILRELHGHQIIHRDIKPSNLMLRMTSGGKGGQVSDTQLVMIDFGGAKQIGPIPHGDRESSPRSSTRLISAGYSPPEQVMGAMVGPATDFYALGRTCIHLLTGQFPGDLDDAYTGELRWREKAQVSPGFAHLLDRMVQLDPRQRPQTAKEIQTDIFRIIRQKKHPRRMMSSHQRLVDNLTTTLIQWDKGLIQLFFGIGKLTIHSVRGLVETSWEIALAGTGSIVGTVVGSILIYFPGLGEKITLILAQELPRILPKVPLTLGAEVLVWGLAGLGAGIGLTDAGGFGQRRRYWLAGIMGMLGYIVGGASEQLINKLGNIGLQGWKLELFNQLPFGIAAGLVTLGLGLRSDQIFQGIFVLLTVTTIFLGFNQFHIFLPQEMLKFPTEMQNFNLPQFRHNLGFMALLSGATAFCLGITHYFILPLLRWFRN